MLPGRQIPAVVGVPSLPYFAHRAEARRLETEARLRVVSDRFDVLRLARALAVIRGHSSITAPRHEFVSLAFCHATDARPYQNPSILQPSVHTDRRNPSSTSLPSSRKQADAACKFIVTTALRPLPGCLTVEHDECGATNLWPMAPRRLFTDTAIRIGAWHSVPNQGRGTALALRIPEASNLSGCGFA